MSGHVNTRTRREQKVRRSVAASRHTRGGGYFVRPFSPADVVSWIWGRGRRKSSGMVDEKPKCGEWKPANVRKTTHRGSAQ